MKITAVIPSRYGSTRFPGKPLALIQGKPMIQRVYERARQSETIHEVVVATDDRRIFEVVEGFGGRAVLTSTDHRSGTDRVAEVARMLGLEPRDVLINIQGDQPLISPRCLDEVTAPFLTDADLHMSTLAHEITDEAEIQNPKHVKVVCNQMGFALYFSRSPIPFGRDPGTAFPTYKHLGVYAYTRHFLETFNRLPEGRLEAIEKLEQLRALEYGYGIKVVFTADDSPEVDLPDDVARIEKLLGLADHV